jgi:hypothetical protein
LRGEHSYCRDFAREMGIYGFTVLRVLFTLDGDYWKTHRCAPDMPGFWEQLAPFFDAMADEGLYVRACLIGALEPFGVRDYDWSRRPDVFKNEVRVKATEYCIRFAATAANFNNAVFEIANEPSQIGMRHSWPELVTIGKRIKVEAPNRLLCAGAADGAGDQEVFFLREPFDFCDAHVERRQGVGGFEWVKRTGEYQPIDQSPEFFPDGYERKPMPFVSGEPINFGERRADGHSGDVEVSPAVAFCYAGVSRARKYNTCFHYDGGLWTTLPKPETVACIRAYHEALDAFPMLDGNKWRGHWAESFFLQEGIYPGKDDPGVVEAHVTAGRGPWRVYGCEDYAVTIAEPGMYDPNALGHLRAPATRLAGASFTKDGFFAGSSIWRRA